METLNLFISYCHKDNEEQKDYKYLDEFLKHLSPLKELGYIDIWYDKKILPGRKFQKEIDKKLENSDIVCLLISKNFLASKACKDEARRAFELHEQKGIVVISIILEPCLWKDWNRLGEFLALPTDGKPISSWENRDEAWVDVCKCLKECIETEIIFRAINLNKKFEDFLNDAGLLSNIHPQKEIYLDDIFIYLDLLKFDEKKEEQETINSKKIVEELFEEKKIVIAGDSQSGKTSLAKKIFKSLRKRNLFPVYISDKEGKLSGNIYTIIKKKFYEEYNINADNNIFEKIPEERIIPIIDDFHYAKNKEKHIRKLKRYHFVVLFVDDIFALNIKDTTLTKGYSFYSIKECKPSLRHELIKKWISLSDLQENSSDFYLELDQKLDLVENTIGKIMGKGIIPAYPFFILSILSFYETLRQPLDQEISSQGYLYQALIYIYLRKAGVKNEEVDTYINFLTEYAHYLFKQQKRGLSEDEFQEFLRAYLDKFHLPIKLKKLLKTLSLTNILIKDNLGFYKFKYEYIYYFFVAKYLSENLDKENDNIIHLFENLQKDENAYIATFLFHHSRDDQLINKIITIAENLFKDFIPARLDKKELSFFDKKINEIVKLMLPRDITPEKTRKDILETKDKLEKNAENNIMEQDEKTNEKENDSLSFRRTLRTVEVIGIIIKNRAGSIEKEKLKFAFKEGMNLILRTLKAFLEEIKNPEIEKTLIEFIKDELQKILTKKNIKRSNINMQKLEKLSRKIFWNINFFIICGFIQKIIHALGSSNLISLTKEVCDKINTPATFMVKNGILLWHNKNLRVDDIKERIQKEDFSELGKGIIKFQVIEYAILHPLTFQERQKIQNILKISDKKLLASYSKNKN